MSKDTSLSPLPPSAKLRAIGVLAEATAATRRALEEKSTFKLFEPGAIVWGDGDAFIAVIQSGHVKLQVMLDSGQSTNLDFLSAGDLAGFIENTAENRLATLYVATSMVIAAIIPLAATRDSLNADPAFREAVIAQTSTQTVQLRQRLFELATLSVQGRVASYLLANAQLYGASHEIRTPLTHEELASLLGSNREAITRTLRSFDKLGLIIYSRHNIRILDTSKLRDIYEKG